MPVAYVDTSAVIAVLFGAPESEAIVRQLDKVEAVYSSTLLEAELFSFLARESMDPSAAQEVERTIRWVLPDRPLTLELRAALHAGYLRGADLWHVACALYLAGSPGDWHFLTCDAKQQEVARRLGFKAENAP